MRTPDTVVKQTGWRAFVVSPPSSGRVRLLLESESRHTLQGAVTLRVNDLASLADLATSGALAGEVSRLTVIVARVPPSSLIGLHHPRTVRETSDYTWRRTDDGLVVSLGWSVPRGTQLALDQLLDATLPNRGIEQQGGPVYAVDRKAWVDGLSTWPYARVSAGAGSAETDEQGRPVGAFRRVKDAPGVAGSPARNPAIVASVANPYGRRLEGDPARYALAAREGEGLVLRDESGTTLAEVDGRRSPEDVLSGAGLTKYGVAVVEAPLHDDRVTRHALRCLGASGIVVATRDPAARAQVTDLGLVVTQTPDDVSDLRGYQLSAAASRSALITAEAGLRRSPLAGDSTVPLPTVSAVVSSKRPDEIETCLTYLGNQTYPSLEVVVGAHGYEVTEEMLARWRDALPVPLTVVPVPSDVPFGSVLAELSRRAEGEYLTKLDDDDHYGVHHVSDLVVASVTTGADLAAKGARFVHLPDEGKTLDRGWTVPEMFNVTPAGGTLLFSRAVLQQVGGWSSSSRHVDADLITRVRKAGGTTYRTHSLDYVYVRRSAGHTWSAQLADLADQARTTYEGLPAGILAASPGNG